MSEDPERTVSTAELGAWLDLSPRSIREHAAAGRLVPRGKGFALQASVRAFSRWQREAMAGRGGQEYQEARTRREQANAEMAELKLAEAQGRVLDAAEVERLWTGANLRCRNHILAVVKKLGMLLGHLSRADLVVIDRLLREALTELGTGKVRMDEQEEGRPQDET